MSGTRFLSNRQMHVTSIQSCLESSETLLTQAVEMLREGFLVTNTLGMIGYANPAAYQLLRVNPDELLGAPISNYLADATTINALLRKAVLGGAQEEVSARTSTGKLLPVLLTVSAVRNAQGIPIGISFLVRDASQQKQREDELEQSNRRKSEFLAHMSHELRTPLTSILGFSSVLLQQIFGELNPKQTQYIHQIHQGGEYLLSLINDVLDLSKIEAGQLMLDLQPTSVADLCQAAIEVLSEQATSKDLTIHTCMMTDQKVYADELRLRQVLLNLLSNAIKFSDAGSEIGIEASLEGQMVALSVWDRGMGIPTQQQHLLFQPFQQLNPACRQVGTGLGLALSRRLVELHHGSIRVESQEGEGSRFTILLPIAA
jgi:PAS domain S-box-containing protein